MSLPTDVQWRILYGHRDTIFLSGIARGDFYRANGDDQGDVFRVRWWPKYRLQGGSEVLVLGEDRARQTLIDLAEQALATEGEAL